MYDKWKFRSSLTAVALIAGTALASLSAVAAPPPSWTPDECCELAARGADPVTDSIFARLTTNNAPYWLDPVWGSSVLQSQDTPSDHATAEVHRKAIAGPLAVVADNFREPPAMALIFVGMGGLIAMRRRAH